MILFDLNCGNGHVFEAWFRSSGDYDDQQGRGLIACPLCNDSHVGKAVTAANVAPKGNQRRDRPAEHADATPVPAHHGNPEAVKAMLHKLAEVQAVALAGAEDVGTRFAEEVRAIHYGEAEDRHIYGETSVDDARSLLDEGIKLAPLLLPVSRRGDA